MLSTRKEEKKKVQRIRCSLLRITAIHVAKQHSILPKSANGKSGMTENNKYKHTIG